MLLRNAGIGIGIRIAWNRNQTENGIDSKTTSSQLQIHIQSNLQIQIHPFQEQNLQIKFTMYSTSHVYPLAKTCSFFNRPQVKWTCCYIFSIELRSNVGGAICASARSTQLCALTRGCPDELLYGNPQSTMSKSVDAEVVHNIGLTNPDADTDEWES